MANPRKLLVEGRDDAVVVANLCQAHQLPDAFEIAGKKGITDLLETLSTQLKTSDLEVLGILVDADTDLQARWQSLRAHLTKEGYLVPDVPVSTGTILHVEDKPTVGIWVMPDNHLPGMLEDFVATLIPDGDALFPYAKECVQKLPEQRFSPALRAKADIHTWLAWQEEPGLPFGTAITASYLDPRSVHAQGFISWLRALFIS